MYSIATTHCDFARRPDLEIARDVLGCPMSLNVPQCTAFWTTVPPQSTKTMSAVHTSSLRTVQPRPHLVKVDCLADTVGRIVGTQPPSYMPQSRSPEHHREAYVSHCPSWKLAITSNIKHMRNKQPNPAFTNSYFNNALRLPRNSILYGSIEHSRPTNPALDPGHKVQSCWGQESAQEVPKAPPEQEQEEQRDEDQREHLLQSCALHHQDRRSTVGHKLLRTTERLGGMPSSICRVSFDCSVYALVRQSDEAIHRLPACRQGAYTRRSSGPFVRPWTINPASYLVAHAPTSPVELGRAIVAASVSLSAH